MRLPQTVAFGDSHSDKELASVESDQGVSSNDANGKSPGRKRPRRRQDRSASPSTRQHTTDSTSGEAMLAGGDKEDNGVSTHVGFTEPATSPSSSASKGWHIAERAERFVAQFTSSVGSRRPPRVPSPMTSPTTAGRGGSSSSSHGAADDSGMSSAGGGSSSGKSRSSRRPHVARSSSSSRLSSLPSSSCTSSVNGLNASVSESSLTTMKDGVSSSPLTVVDWSAVVKTMTGRPGAVGIVNHTNTCFINAVVQCLGHTAPLVAELLSRVGADRRRATFHTGNRSVIVRASSPMLLTDSGGEDPSSHDGFGRRRNPNPNHVKDSDVFGSAGRILGRRCKSESHADKLSRYGAMSATTRVVSERDACGSSDSNLNGHRDDHVTTRSLTNLVNGLWTGHYSTSVSYGFCETVRHLAPDLYNVCTEQHDAHEFFVWLLDRLNDDQKTYNTLCRSDGGDVTNAKYATTSRVCDTAPSIVQNLFSATCRSTLACPGCEHRSEKLEPYTSVSLPISTPRPKRRQADSGTRQAVYVTVVRTRSTCDNGTQTGIRPRRYGWQADPGGSTVQHLKEALTRRCHIPDSQLVLAEVRGYGFNLTLHGHQMVAELRRAHTIYAFEAEPPSRETGKSRARAGGQSELSEQTISVIVLSIDSKYAKRLGQPFVVRLKRNITYADLEIAMLKQITDAPMSELLNVTYKRAGESECSRRLFRIRLLDGLSDVSPFIDPEDSTLPLCSPTVQQALTNCTDGYGPQHVKLVLEWEYKARLSAGLHTSSSSDVDDDVTYTRLKMKELRIGADVAVTSKLADCLRAFTQQERLDDENGWQCSHCLKTQPGVLKKLTFCSLPDILVLHLKRFQQIDGGSRIKLDILVQFPVTESLDLSDFVDQAECHGSDDRPKFTGSATESSNQDYYLYAVCNHIGTSLQGGHYTAFCRSPHSGEWNSYDDQNVSPVNREDIVTKDAYILFYERRGTMRSNDVITRIVTWLNGSRQRTVEIGLTSKDSSDASFDSTTCGWSENGDVSRSSKSSSRRAQHRSRSLPFQSNRSSSKNAMFSHSFKNDKVVTHVRSKHDDKNVTVEKPSITKTDLVTEEFKERARPTQPPVSQLDAEVDASLMKSARNPPSCLKKTQRPPPSKFPMWNALFSKKPHGSHSRPSSAAGHYPRDRDSSDGRRNSFSSTLPRSTSGKLFRSISAGRVYDNSLNNSVMHGSSETVHRRVRWDPSSESPKEKKQSLIPMRNPPRHMVVQESCV